MSPEGIAPGIEEAKLTVDAPDCDVAEEPITTGSEARCFAKYMRIHALESSGGLTYAEMGRYVSASDPSNPAGTNDEAAALKDESGKPVSNAARNTWVTETALSTALNVSYMATGVAIFSHRRRGRADPRRRRVPAPRSRRLPRSKPRSEADVGAVGRWSAATSANPCEAFEYPAWERQVPGPPHVSLLIRPRVDRAAVANEPEQARLGEHLRRPLVEAL